MVSIDTILGWAAIGVAAGLAGMIWPFRRGAVGVAANVAVGVAGAIGGALLGGALWPAPSGHDSPARLAFAAAGSLAALALVHLAWLGVAKSRLHVSRPSGPGPTSAASARR